MARSERISFAEAVRRVRTSAGLTQAELAERAGLTRTTLVRLENGLQPGPLAQQRLVAAFGFTIGAELFAAAGDRVAAAHLAGYAAVNDRAKRPAAAPIAAAGASKRAAGGNALRWRVMG